MDAAFAQPQEGQTRPEVSHDLWDKGFRDLKQFVSGQISAAMVGGQMDIPTYKRLTEELGKIHDKESLKVFMQTLAGTNTEDTAQLKIEFGANGEIIGAFPVEM